MSDPEENVPLVAKPGKQPRQWRGHPLNTFGECSATDAAACCLAWNAPAIAFGFNASRGLGLTWWKEALKLFALTCGSFCVVRLVLYLLVLTQCGKECPYAHNKDAHSKDLGAPMTKIMPLAVASNPGNPGNLAIDPTVKTATVTTQTDPAAAVSVAAIYDKPADKKKGCKEGKDKSSRHDKDSNIAKTTVAAADIVNAGPYPVDDDHDQDDKDHDKKHFGFRFDDHKAKKEHDHDHDKKDHDKSRDWDDDDDDDDHDHDHDKHHGHGKWHHDHDELFEKLAEHPDKLKKCAYKIAPWASITIAVGVAVFVYGSYYAALRRQALRERFGIEGKFSRDWLLWAFCGPCVLTQETRTLMHNNVEEGLWHGPLSAPAPVAPMAV